MKAPVISNNKRRGSQKESPPRINSSNLKNFGDISPGRVFQASNQRMHSPVRSPKNESSKKKGGFLGKVKNLFK